MSSKDDVDITAAYEKLKKNGQNTVDNLVQWLKEAKVLEMVQKTEDDARKLFGNVKDKEQVTEEKFKEIMSQLTDSNSNYKTLMDTFLDKFNTFKEALKVIRNTNNEMIRAYAESSKMKQIEYRDDKEKNDEEDDEKSDAEETDDDGDAEDEGNEEKGIVLKD